MVVTILLSQKNVGLCVILVYNWTDVNIGVGALVAEVNRSHVNYNAISAVPVD